MNILEVVSTRVKIEIELDLLIKKQIECVKSMNEKIKFLNRLEHLHAKGLYIEKIQIAEAVITVEGSPWNHTFLGQKTIAEEAIEDAADNFKCLRRKYFGNKQYKGLSLGIGPDFYQRSDHPYGEEPKIGNIVDRISLINVDKIYSKDELSAVIYYIQNYARIKETNEDNRK